MARPRAHAAYADLASSANRAGRRIPDRLVLPAAIPCLAKHGRK
jgi:hypothetical protein